MFLHQTRYVMAAGELVESLARLTECFALFAPTLYVLSSNPIQDNFTFHLFGIDKSRINLRWWIGRTVKRSDRVLYSIVPSFCHEFISRHGLRNRSPDLITLLGALDDHRVAGI